MREGWREAAGIVKMSPMSTRGSVPLRTSGKRGEQAPGSCPTWADREPGHSATTSSPLVSHQLRAASEGGPPRLGPCPVHQPSPLPWPDNGPTVPDTYNLQPSWMGGRCRKDMVGACY